MQHANPPAAGMPGEPPVVTIFSDFASPHAYVTETALRALAATRPVEIRYRALEIHPAPAPPPDPGISGAWVAEIAPLAAAEGLAISPPAFLPRTRKCHEAARYAGEHGREGALRNAIHRAYWQRGLDIGRIDVLAGLGEEAGLDPVDLRIALDIDLYRDNVRRDAETAARLNVSIVPTLYVGSGPGARIMVGAQTRDGLDVVIPRR